MTLTVNASLALGLSPRMRGNHSWMLALRWCFASHGSIPAHAGEPVDRSQDDWVYPRACGGWGRLRGCVADGLSPRMRGNLVAASPATVYPRACGGDDRLVGSIPAHAGEPWPDPTLACGLSPRMRCRMHHGSIPAHAGEPLHDPRDGARVLGLSPRMRGNRPTASQPERLRLLRVYPRACGGTSGAFTPRSW